MATKTANTLSTGFYQTIHLAPRARLEPITTRLTAECSTIDMVTYRKISLATNYKQNRISHSIFASHHILFFR